MKKKKILLTLGIAAMMGLAGCGETSTDPQTPVDPPVVTVDPVVTGITLKAAGDKTSLEVGETLQLTATVTGEGDFNKQVTYSVDKTDLAEVSSAGLLTAKAKGTVRVTATAAGDTSKKASLDIVIIKTQVTGITLTAEGDATSVKISETLKLTATVAGEGNFNNKYTLSVDKPAIASISDEGVLTGKSAGTVKVTATATGDTSKTASLDITVTAAPVSAIKDVVVDKYAHVIGKVTSVGVGLYFIDDGTGAMEVYYGGYDHAIPEDIALGKVVELAGVAKDNYGIMEFDATSGKDEYFTAAISDKTIESTTLDSLTKLDAAGYDAIAKTADKLTPIKFRGTALEGLEFKVDDASTEKLHVSYASDATKAAIKVGDEYDIVGYMAPYHTTKNYNQLFVAEVKDAVYPPESVSITGDTTVRATETIKLTASVSPAKASQSITWSSSDETKAKVAADGTVTGVAEGQVTITATATGTTVKKEIVITVTAAPTAPVESVTINKESFALDFPAESDALTATVLPANAPTGVTWTSSDETVAKIVTAEDGTVTVKSVGKGTATITATSVGKDADNVSKTASITVTVNRQMIADLPNLEAEAQSDLYAKVIGKDGQSLYINDGTNAFTVYNEKNEVKPNVGDYVRIAGVVETRYNGLQLKVRKDKTNVEPNVIYGDSLAIVDTVDFAEATPAEVDAATLKSDIYDVAFNNDRSLKENCLLPVYKTVKLSDVTVTGGSAQVRECKYGDVNIRSGVAKGMEIGRHYDITAVITNVYSDGSFISFYPLEATLTEGYVFAEAEDTSIDEGATTTITATTVGKEESGDTYDFVSSDTDVLDFDGAHENVASAVVLGVKAGTATVTVTSKTTGKSTTVEMTVEGSIKSKTVTFKSGDFGSNTTKAGGTYQADEGEPTWTYDASSANWNWDTNRGIQIGTGSSPINGTWTISAPVSDFGTFGVVGVSVNASMASSGNTKVAIDIGDTHFLAATAVTTSAADYTAADLLTTPVTDGNIVITLSNTKKAAYLKSITVYYAAKALSA